MKGKWINLTAAVIWCFNVALALKIGNTWLIVMYGVTACLYIVITFISFGDKS